MTFPFRTPPARVSNPFTAANLRRPDAAIPYGIAASIATPGTPAARNFYVGPHRLPSDNGREISCQIATRPMSSPAITAEAQGGPQDRPISSTFVDAGKCPHNR
jgi:hypothetical protein